MVWFLFDYREKKLSVRDELCDFISILSFRAFEYLLYIFKHTVYGPLAQNNIIGNVYFNLLTENANLITEHFQLLVPLKLN